MTHWEEWGHNESLFIYLPFFYVFVYIFMGVGGGTWTIKVELVWKAYVWIGAQ